MLHIKQDEYEMPWNTRFPGCKLLPEEITRHHLLGVKFSKRRRSELRCWHWPYSINLALKTLPAFKYFKELLQRSCVCVCVFFPPTLFFLYKCSWIESLLLVAKTPNEDYRSEWHKLWVKSFSAKVIPSLLFCFITYSLSQNTSSPE